MGGEIKMTALICDCPRATGVIHFEACPLHDPRACAVCEMDGHETKLKAENKALREALEGTRSLTIPGNDEDALYHIANVAKDVLKGK